MLYVTLCVYVVKYLSGKVLLLGDCISQNVIPDIEYIYSGIGYYNYMLSCIIMYSHLVYISYPKKNIKRMTYTPHILVIHIYVLNDIYLVPTYNNIGVTLKNTNVYHVVLLKRISLVYVFLLMLCTGMYQPQ